MTCLEVLELLHAALDTGGAADGDDAAAGLDVARRAEMQAHVASCADCAKAARQLPALRAALRAMPAVHAPDGFRDRVMSALGGGGRLLAFRRLLVPVAAAAVLVAGFVVIQRVQDAAEVTVGAAAKNEASGAALRESAETGDRRRGLTAHDALDATRKNRIARQGDSAKARSGDADEDTAGAPPAARPEASPERAKAPAPASDPASQPPGERSAAAPDDAPASAGGTASGDEKHEPRSAKSDAAAEQPGLESKALAARPVHVVVFRSEAEARAFLASIESSRERTRDGSKSREKDPARAPEQDTAGGGDTGGGPGGGASGGGGGAPASGGKGKSGGRAGAASPPADPRTAVPPAPAGGTAATSAPVRVVGRVAVETDAWRTHARLRHGAVLDGLDVAVLDREAPDPDALRRAIETWRLANPGLSDRIVDRGDDLAKDRAELADGEGGTPRKEARKQDEPPPAPPAASATAFEQEFAARARVTILVVVEDVAPPAAKPAAPAPVPPPKPPK